MAFTGDLRENFFRLTQNFPGYDEVLAQALFALLTREHMMWYSRPGRAKSLVASSIFGMFDGAPTFRVQLTKDMMQESVFGNIKIDELTAHGREEYNLDGGIVTSVFAYLDEFFDASDFLLRAMLNVLNEREFHSKDMGTVTSPLHSVIATTNYVRQREATEAVLDRLLCKAVLLGIDGVVDSMSASQTYLSYSGKAVPLTKLAYGDLLELAENVERPEADGGIAIAPGMRMLHVLLLKEFQKRRIDAATAKWHATNKDAAEEPTEIELGVPDLSPRTLVKLHDFSRAAAVLGNRQKVEPQDMRALVYGLVTIGDGSGDEQVWHALCDEFLPFNRRQLKSLEELGELADTIGQIKQERSLTTPAQLAVGGRLPVRTALEVRTALNMLTRANHPVLKLAQQQLDAEVTSLGTSRGKGYDLLNGWQ